ncbi:hypothetical protein C9374_004106 [Naegleria lovaniensis]|uniref:carbonic anhydrase n=1 Tax=Naegleria lovaniensis TaxID=51637 RepID=A0AA88KLA4_NAELO|nr:uncharacterized protein C9374_004106 [Naegleria lovaniensis]KAG2383435.1 hypothetical protein C9374_004106 [Naegleria lovaniensis]
MTCPSLPSSRASSSHQAVPKISLLSIVLLLLFIHHTFGCDFSLPNEKPCLDWSYSEANQWAQQCPNSQCGGSSQSPVPILSFQNIISYDQYLLQALYNNGSNPNTLPSLLYDFSNETKRSLTIHGLFQEMSKNSLDFTLLNSGHTIMLSLNETSSAMKQPVYIDRYFLVRETSTSSSFNKNLPFRPSSVALKVPGYNSIRVPYRLKQFHFHTPSEHVFNWFSYDLEVHFVFQREDLEKALDALVPRITVVGVVLQALGMIDHPLIDVVVRNKDYLMKHVGKPVNTREVTSGMLFDMVPLRQELDPLFSYFVYNGSLTTPNCNENVMWNVVNPNIFLGASQYISLNQMAALRQIMNQAQHGKRENSSKVRGLSSSTGDNMTSTDNGFLGNNRPLQSLNGRKIISITR